MKISRVWWRGLIATAGLPAALVLAVFAVGCGDVFRPVAVPITGPPGDPQPTSFTFVVSQNAPANDGSALQINVPGDSAVFSTPAGVGPVHAAFLPPGESRIFVANRDDDTVTTYLPSVTFEAPTTLNLPAGSKPVFLATAESQNMYVANAGAGANTVGVINGVQAALTTLVPVGNTPVALAETKDGKKLYTVNMGDGTVSVIETTGDTVVNTIGVGNAPVWADFSPDGLELYVLNQGSGTVSVIDSTSDTVVAVLTTGAAPDHMVVDTHRNRLYVVNTGSNNVSIFDASVDPPKPLNTVALPVQSPTSIAVLPNGSKAYIPSLQITAPASDPLCPLSGKPCQFAVVSVAVMDTTSNTVLRTVSAKSPVMESIDPVTQQLVPLLCNPGNVPFTQTGGVRFRAFATPSSNSNRVFISSCDAGVVHILNTVNDSFVTNIAAPVSSFAPPTSTSPPPFQQPVFVLPGP